jgi:hypothetical protein
LTVLLLGACGDDGDGAGTLGNDDSDGTEESLEPATPRDDDDLEEPFDAGSDQGADRADSEGSTTRSDAASQGSRSDASTSGSARSDAATDRDSSPGETPSDSDGGGAPPAGGSEPRIPEIKGECPTFKSGSAQVGRLRATMNVGTPGATKGALLFGFHGTGGAGSASIAPKVQAEITGGGGITVSFRYRSGGMTDIAPPTGTWFVEDMEVVDQIVACAVKNHNIDPRRIHATGCSAGGLMAGTLGLMRSSYMASVAPNSGGINYMNSRMLQDPARAPAGFTMHGGSADNVIVNFENTSKWFHAQIQKAPAGGFLVDCMHGRGHCGAGNALFEQAWEFMKAHPYGIEKSPFAEGLPSTFPSYCKLVPKP